MSESKMSIYLLLPSRLTPKTILIPCTADPESVLMRAAEAGISFPMIAKPDIGLRGSAVKKLDSLLDLEDYHHRADFEYLLQDLIPYSNEVGIFYVRYPNSRQGLVTGIVAKDFLRVTGDGVSTIKQLLDSNIRYAFQMKAIEREIGAMIDTVPPKGEILNLVPYGNHARGAKFTDASHLISPALTAQIDKICSNVEGFYFGRLDIMYKDWQSLERGEDFMIVELNGTASEPTHIYDPKHSIFFAWRELIKHIRMMFEIGQMNVASGHRYLSWREGCRAYRLHRMQSKKIIRF